MRRLVLVLAVVWLARCGNPAMHRYLVLDSPQSSEQKKLNTGLHLRKNPEVIMEVPKADELDSLADSLGIGIEQKYYRLPPISIFKFSVENNGPETQAITFSDCVFSNDLGESFPVIERTSYERRFTSSAYQRFPYTATYSFYFIKHPEKKKKEFGPYLARVLPEESIDMPADSKGQIFVPFELLNPSSRRYHLTCPTLGIEQKYYYRTIRADRE